MALSFNPRRTQAEFVLATLWVALAIWLYVEAGNFSSTSATFPRALALLLGICGLLQGVKTLRKLRQQPSQERLFHAPGRVLMAFVLIFGYLLLMSWIGYIAASVTFGLLLPLLAGYRHWKHALLVISGTLLFIWLVFNVLLQRPLPQGIVEAWIGGGL